MKTKHLLAGISAFCALAGTPALAQDKPYEGVTVNVMVADAAQATEAISSEVDDLVCIETPSDLMAISIWYRNFEQVPDEEVIELLKNAQRSTAE